jgi:hypothetical protein
LPTFHRGDAGWKVLWHEFLMVAVPLIRSLLPAIEVKRVGRKPISFELKTLLIKTWHDLTYEGT